MKYILLMLTVCIYVITVDATKREGFDGLNMNLGNLYRLSGAKTRSIGPENLTGEAGKGGMATLENGTARNNARELGQGWKVNPYLIIQPSQTITLAEINGQGALQHIWMTITGNWRFSILRFYWDDEEYPSVEVPAGDFFGMGWGEYAPLNSLPVTENPGTPFSYYWRMPYR